MGPRSLDDLMYTLRYGLGKEAYKRKAAGLVTPPEVAALAQGNPNVIDRYQGQRIAAEDSYWPEMMIGAANEHALGDPYLDKPTRESERTKAAGDIGRKAGSGARKSFLSGLFGK